MVAVRPLVTGANGYLDVWVIQKYLEAGYAVRGTVRCVTKGAFAKDRFAKYGNRFELCVVNDITKDGAFDEAIEGVEVVAHLSSPFHFRSLDPNEYITPAVQGTLSVLNSASKDGSSVKRIVLTSSVVTILENLGDPEPCVFDESNWNDAAIEQTLAEQAAWDFISAHKGELPWGLVALNLSYIFGPSLSTTRTADDINASQRQVYDTLTGRKTSAELQWLLSWCHVAVAAEAHVRATYTASAGGERIIIRTEPFYVQDMLDAASELEIPDMPREEPGATNNLPRLDAFHSTKAEDLLGLKKTHQLKDMVEDSVEDFRPRSYLGFIRPESSSELSTRKVTIKIM